MGKRITSNISKGKIVIYKSKDEPKLEVHFKGETVWLRQDEIAKLFGKERSVITKHINKIFSDKEVNKKNNVQFLHIANSDKPVSFYSLDVILAVGYRTNSMQFPETFIRHLAEKTYIRFPKKKNRVIRKAPGNHPWRKLKFGKGKSA